MEVLGFIPLGKVVIAGTQRTAGYSPDFSLENNSREQLYLGILNFSNIKCKCGDHTQSFLSTCAAAGVKPTL